MELAEHPGPRGHERLTVAAAALAVLAVLLGPAGVAGLLGLVAPPPEQWPTYPLTERAERVAQLPGTTVLQDKVVLTLTPEMHAPAMTAEARVVPDDSAGQLVPIGVSGLLPMNPYLAPQGSGALMEDLWPGDRVFANLGPLVMGCLPADDAECTPTLLTQHNDGYYRYPRSLGSGEFLQPGSRMEAQTYDVLGGRLVIGGLTGTRTDRVAVRLDDDRTITAYTTTSASPGDVIWWASFSDPEVSPAQATAYDERGRRVDTVDLNGQL